jgi:hypothetical protein
MVCLAAGERRCTVVWLLDLYLKWFDMQPWGVPSMLYYQMVDRCKYAAPRFP